MISSVNIHRIGIGESSYEIFKSNKLGEGVYSSVCLGRCIGSLKYGHLVAVKKIVKSNLSNRGLHMLLSEIEISKGITANSHKNIVSYYDVIDDIDVIYIVMEYCSNGDFSLLLSKKPIKYEYIKYYFNQIMDALKYLCDNDIIHRDIKPKNILVTNDNQIIKLCDFGFAKHNAGLKRVVTVCGSPLYMAPEIYNKVGYSGSVDVWSIGLILYEMIFGHHPLEKCNDPQKLAQSIITTDIDIPKNDNVSDDCIDLLQQMLKRKDFERITIENMFKHKWILECQNQDVKILDNNFTDIYVGSSIDPTIDSPVNSITESTGESSNICNSYDQCRDNTLEYSSLEKDINCIFSMDDE